MSYEVNAHSLHMTTECRDNFSCLSGEDRCLCEVNKHIVNNGGSIFIIPNNEMRDCNYMLPYAFSSFICNCPVREALYIKYKI
jgi:hypothetical protein